MGHWVMFQYMNASCDQVKHFYHLRHLVDIFITTL